MRVRFLHTSDWHLGRQFHHVSLIEDQAHVLDQLVTLARQSKVDAIVVAGDLYDRAVPPTEAVALLDETLTRLVLDLKIPFLAIAGNHDSPERLAFGARLLAAKNLHLAGGLTRSVVRATLRDAHGPATFHLVPYAEPPVARQVFADPTLADHDLAMRAVVARIPSAPRSILVAHAFVAGGEASESERPLSVGGAGTVDAATFEPFAYAALGHLHRPQSVGRETVRYSGSLLKYSFQESKHRKSVSIIDLNGDGECRIEEVPLSARRNVRRIEGTLAELLGAAERDAARNDYIEASLHGREALIDPMGDLRRVYPNVLSVRYPLLEQMALPNESPRSMARVTDADLFASFFAEVTGGPLSPAERAALEAVLESRRLKEREVSV